MNENNMIVQMTIADLKCLIKETVEEAIKQKDYKKPKKDKNENNLLTREETANFLKVEKETLWNWNKKGELKALKIGRRVYYKKEDIMAKLKGN